tara:strand:- start:231 stop:893 length:663 start_codon:yes stop_codon:yes gene_type:complete
MSAGEFIPEVKQTRECPDLAAYGTASTVDSYIIKMGPQEPEDEFPTDICPPKYHSRAKIDTLNVTNLGDGIIGATAAINTPSAAITCTSVTASGNITAGSFSSNSKAFNIPHPSPGKDGKRLWHGCLEGPEYGVYFRGRVKNREEISYPSYWKDLIDWTTITVNLTPIGAHQNVIIKRLDEDKIYLQSKGGMPIDCFYHIYATRKDIPRLEVEPEVDKES